MRGSPTLAMATDRRRFMPPEKVSTPAPATSSRPTVCSRASTCESSSWSGTPRKRAKSSMCARALSSSQSRSSCGQVPMMSRSTAVSLRMDLPKRKASPCVGEMSPDMTLTSVDLPAPFWPSSAMSWPGGSMSDTSLTAVVCANIFESLCSRTEPSCAESACTRAMVSPGSSVAGRLAKPQ